MKIACLQLAPELGKVEQNIAKADQILRATDGLETAADGSPLWLILPEMAFSGYNFSGLAQIEPYLEPTTAGASTKWAQRTAQQYRCHVTAGYPEKAQVSTAEGIRSRNYNSLVTVSPSGAIVAHYRKRYLYYTDETWASEGDETRTPSGFFAGDIDGIAVAQGICMDINPYRFEAPWDKYEFANHVIASDAQLAIVSMAWLTRLSRQELLETPQRPDDDMFSYWIERFFPLRNATGSSVFLVLANRCGSEGEACYAGTSSVVSFRGGRSFIYDMLGKHDERCMIVDLDKPPKYEIHQAGSVRS